MITDLILSVEQITIVYKKRWGVEEYHQYTKSNSDFAQLQIKFVVYLKPEWLEQRIRTVYFAIKNKIYLIAQQAASPQLKKLSTLKAA